MVVSRLFPLFLLIAALCLVGCAGPSYSHSSKDLEYEVLAINQGTIGTDGMRISTNRGYGFELTSEQPWEAPFFQGEDCLISPTVDNYGDAIDKGARQVEVHHPAHSEPLYGVLSLCGRVNGAIGPGARSYQILVPDRFVAETSGGRATVVYELHNYDPETMRANGYASGGAKSWILWLSQVPFDVEAGRNGAESLAEAVGPPPVPPGVLYGGAAGLGAFLLLMLIVL